MGMSEWGLVIGDWVIGWMDEFIDIIYVIVVLRLLDKRGEERRGEKRREEEGIDRRTDGWIDASMCIVYRVWSIRFVNECGWRMDYI